MTTATLVSKRGAAKRVECTPAYSGLEAEGLDILCNLTSTVPLFPDLSVSNRTLGFLTLLADTNILKDAALMVNVEGQTLFEPLLNDVHGLHRVEANGVLVPRSIVDRLVNKLAEVAQIWLCDDVCVLARDINNDLHLHRMHVLRKVESLVANPQCCAAWSTLGLTVAGLAEARRHNAGLRPLSVTENPSLFSARMEEARARLLVRVRIQAILHDAQMRNAVQPEHSLVVLLWASTVDGLRLFAVQLNREMVLRMALRDATASSEIAMASECRLVQAMQVRPCPILNDETCAGLNMQMTTSPQLLPTNDPDAEKDASVIASDACLLVPAIDTRSDVILAVLRDTCPNGWMLRSPYASGLAAGLMSVDESNLCVRACAKTVVT